MEQREKLLRRVGLKCADFARQLSYHRALDKYRGSFNLNFWICMYNNAIDLAVLDWFHLFGYHNDDLHWKNVVGDIEAFREGLYECLGIDEKQWKSYYEKVKEYRDKDIAHIEVRPVSNVPQMSIALNAADYYYQHVLRELSEFSDYSGWPSNLIEYYKKSLAQTRDIISAAYNATESMVESLNGERGSNL